MQRSNTSLNVACCFPHMQQPRWLRRPIPQPAHHPAARPLAQPAGHPAAPTAPSARRRPCHQLSCTTAEAAATAASVGPAPAPAAMPPPPPPAAPPVNAARAAQPQHGPAASQTSREAWAASAAVTRAPPRLQRQSAMQRLQRASAAQNACQSPLPCPWRQTAAAAVPAPATCRRWKPACRCGRSPASKLPGIVAQALPCLLPDLSLCMQVNRALATPTSHLPSPLILAWNPSLSGITL